MKYEKKETINEIPIMNMPLCSTYCEVIQVETKDKQYIRCDPFDNHRKIFRKFASELGIEILNTYQEEEFPKDSDYKLVGAGLCDIDIKAKEMYFFGWSGIYCIGINEEHLEKLKKQLPDWEIKSSKGLPDIISAQIDPNKKLQYLKILENIWKL